MKSCEAHRQWYYWLTSRGANDSLSKWRKQVDLNRGKTRMAMAWFVSLSFHLHLIGWENGAILDDQWQSRKNVAIQDFLRHCMIKIKRNILNFHLDSSFTESLHITFFTCRTNLLSTLISCLKSDDANVRKVICYCFSWSVLSRRRYGFHRPDLKTGVGSGFGELGGTHLPRILRNHPRPRGSRKRVSVLEPFV